jgi:hypothetical protein
MFKILPFCAAVILAAASTSVAAHADDLAHKYYAEAGYDYAKFHGSPSIGYSALKLAGGVQFNTYFAVEAEGDVGVGKKSVTLGGFKVDTKLESSLAAYLVGSYPVSSHVDVLARIGAVTAKISADAGFGKTSASRSGLAYGVGVRYFPNGGLNGVRADITHYDLKNGNGDVAEIAYVRRF